MPPRRPAPAPSGLLWRRRQAPAWSAAVRGGRNRVAGRDGAADGHLGVDAAVRMTKGAQESWRNVEIPDARAGFHIGGGAAHNVLDDSRTRLRTDRDVLAEQVEFAPCRPTFHIEVAAKPQWIDRTPNHALDGRDRGEVDDGNHLLGDVRKAMTRRGQHLR